MDSDTVVVADVAVAVVGYGRMSSYLEISDDDISSWSWLELWPPCCWEKQNWNSDDRRDSSHACPSSCVASSSKLTSDEYACDLANLVPILLETDSLIH